MRIKHANNNILLKEGETIIWCGKPTVSKVLCTLDRVLVPLSIIIFAADLLATRIIVENIAYSVGHGYSLSHDQKHIIPMIILYNLLVLYFMFGRFMVKAFEKSHLSYYITNARIIVLRLGSRMKILEIDIRDVKNITVIERIGNIGTIQINGTNASINQLQFLWLEVPFVFTRMKKIILFDIRNVDDIMRVIGLVE